MQLSRSQLGILLLLGSAAMMAAPVGCSSDDTKPAGAAGSAPGSSGASGSAGDASVEAASDSEVPEGAAGSSGAPADSSSDSTLDSAPDDAESPEDGASADADDGSADSGAACSSATSWAAGTVLALSSPEQDRLGSITPDELTIAWVVPASASTSTVWYADRSAADAPFGAAAKLSDTLGPFAIDRAALSADGLRLAIVTESRKSVVEVTRKSRAEPFGSTDSGKFWMLNDAGTQMPADQYFGDLLFSADDRVLYFSRYGGGAQDTLMSIMRVFATDPWPVAIIPAGGDEFKASGDLRRRPTGLTQDQTGLFYYDEVDQKQKIAWRSALGLPFDQFSDLGAIDMAQPSASCKLYYSAQNNTSVDLFVASPKGSN